MNQVAQSTGEAHRDVSKPTWVRYQVLGALCVLAVIIYVHRVGFARALPDIKTSLGLDDRHASYLTAIFLLAYGGFEIPWGMLGDRFGARKVLPMLVLAWSLATACTSLVLLLPDTYSWSLPFAALLALRFVFGLFQAGAFPVIARVIADWMPRQERAFSQGSMWMCTRLGGMMIPLFLGWLMEVYGNWQTPLWIVGAVGAFWCLGFWPWFRNRPEEMSSVNEAERYLIAHDRAPAAQHGAVPWRQMLSSRSCWCLCLMYGFAGGASNFYVTLLPVYLRNYRHLSDDETSLLASLPFLCGAGACLFSGLLSDWLIRRLGNRRWGRSINGTIGTFVAAIAWLTLDHIQGTALLAFVLCLIFFCNDLNMGPAWASCADIGERHAGTLGGAMNMMANILGAGANLLTGYLLDINQSGLLFTIFGCMYFAACLCWIGMDVTRPLTRTHHA